MKTFHVITVLALAMLRLGAEPGLICTATDGERRVTFITPTPNFTLRETQSIHPQLKPEFSAEWSGVIHIERAGAYAFFAAAKVFIDGTEVVSRPMRLAAGDRRIRLEFRRVAGLARSQLEWQSEFFKREPVPMRALAHDITPTEARNAESLARGRQLFEDFNCGACHATKRKFIAIPRAPDLSRAGARLNADWIYQWLESPRSLHAWARMPTVLNSPQDRADVTAFLATLTSPTNQVARTKSRGRSEAGKQLFAAMGCAACHGPNDINLAGVAAKMNAAQLAERLRAPLALNERSRCPDFSVSETEAVDIAEFLASNKAALLRARPAGDAQRGRKLITSAGCVNCHAVREAGVALKTAIHPPALETLRADRGCLANTHVPNAPRYDFTFAERRALRAFVQSPDICEAPVQDFARVTSQLRCTACHDVFQPATLEVTANNAPPSLVDTGNKVRRSWLQRVLLEKKRARPWLATRMPHFGPQVATLVDGFAAQTGAEPGEGVSVPTPSFAELQRGIKLLGKNDGGLGCIACHDFRGARASGDLHGPDMIEMSDRLRADWIARWLRDPARICPGTPMPTFFADVPEVDAHNKISTIVQTLAAGRDMPMPEGIDDSAAPYILRVANEPVVFRGFIGDTPRAIAIGLPGMISCAFDADACRLRCAWAGDFLDVKPTWANRGGLPANIVGRKFFVATNVAAIRIGTDTRSHARFRGYRLRNQSPELIYELDGVTITETFASQANPPALVRNVNVAQTTRPIFFNGTGTSRIVVGAKTLNVKSGWALIATRGPIEFHATFPVTAP